MKKVTKEVRPAACRRRTMKLSSGSLCFSRSPGHRADRPSMAWQRSTGILPVVPLRSLRCSAACRGDERQKQSTATSKAKAQRRAPRGVVLLILLLSLLGRGRRSPLSAPSIAGHGGQAPKEARQDAEAFSPRHGWRVEKPRHGREAQGIGSRFCFSRSDAAPGARFFGYFLFAEKKVTRATARNSAQ